MEESTEVKLLSVEFNIEDNALSQFLVENAQSGDPLHTQRLDIYIALVKRSFNNRNSPFRSS